MLQTNCPTTAKTDTVGGRDYAAEGTRVPTRVIGQTGIKSLCIPIGFPIPVCPITHIHTRLGRQRYNACIRGCMKVINFLWRSLALSDRACWMWVMFDSSCHFMKQGATTCSLSCTPEHSTCAALVLCTSTQGNEMIKTALIKNNNNKIDISKYLVHSPAFILSGMLLAKSLKKSESSSLAY